jgi:hypothetical protein
MYIQGLYHYGYPWRNKNDKRHDISFYVANGKVYLSNIETSYDYVLAKDFYQNNERHHSFPLYKWFSNKYFNNDYSKSLDYFYKYYGIDKNTKYSISGEHIKNIRKFDFEYLRLIGQA